MNLHENPESKCNFNIILYLKNLILKCNFTQIEIWNFDRVLFSIIITIIIA